MTDARLPERYLSDRRVLALSDSAFRLYMLSLMWSVANRSDGELDDRDLRMLPGGSDPADQAEILAAELWSLSTGVYVINDYATTQTSRHELELLENVRRRDREKKARQRAAKHDNAEHVPGDSTRDSRGDGSPGTAQEGKERQEGRKALQQEPPTNLSLYPLSQVAGAT